MSGAVAPTADTGDRAARVSLAAIQAPVRQRLDQVVPELHRVVVSDLPMIEQVSGHLLRMRGKLFRPTLALLASEVEGRGETGALTVAAAIELMHLATLVHDDSVDHSVLRRGLPTVNALFSHQVSVIMGDFLYTRALRALVGLNNLPVLKILVDVANQLTIGEMRQLAAIDRLGFTEDAYFKMIRAKTASLLAAACETGDWLHVDVYLTRRPGYRAILFPGSRYDDDFFGWIEQRECAVVAVGRRTARAALTVAYPGAGDPVVDLLVETSAVELIAAELWARST